MSKPKCLECGADTAVLESRPGDGKPIMMYRTRRCIKCKAKFVTLEIYAPQQTIPNEYRNARLYQKH